ncbi:MAG: biotin--[acetyl-CoA-carboxylase] ligase [Acidimicrobiales bacterium]
MCAAAAPNGTAAAADADSPYVLVDPPPHARVELRHFAEVDSTNRYLVDIAHDWTAPGRSRFVAAVADHQLAGRGRLGRRWQAPAGANLLMSVLCAPAPAAEQLHLCTVAMALAGVHACASAAGVELSVKWPNDLVSGSSKVGGVLAEAVATGPLPRTGPGAVVVGMGLNVGWPGPGDVVDGELAGATSLRLVSSGPLPAPVDLAGEVLRALVPLLDDLVDERGRAAVVAQLRERCTTIGRSVRVELGERTIEGRAVDVTPAGHLVVETASGAVTVSAGDVVHLRPAG